MENFQETHTCECQHSANTQIPICLQNVIINPSFAGAVIDLVERTTCLEIRRLASSTTFLVLRLHRPSLCVLENIADEYLQNYVKKKFS